MTPGMQQTNGAPPSGAVPPAVLFGAAKPVLMGYREYARHRGCALTAVQRAIAAGRIGTVDVDGRKMIDQAAADRDWARNTEARPGNQNGAAAAASQLALPGAENFQRPAAPVAVADDPESYTVARAKREMAQAKLAELELAEKMGILVRRDQMESGEIESGRRIKQALENMPSQCSAILAATSDEHEVHRILRVEIRKVLEVLSGSLAGAARAEAA